MSHLKCIFQPLISQCRVCAKNRARPEVRRVATQSANPRVLMTRPDVVLCNFFLGFGPNHLHVQKMQYKYTERAGIETRSSLKRDFRQKIERNHREMKSSSS